MTERDELVHQLGNLMDELSPLLIEKGHDKGVLLHQMINLHANEDALRGILADLEKHQRQLHSG